MEEKTIIVAIGGGRKLDEYDLAGFTFTEEQKEALEKLKISVEAIRVVMDMQGKELAETIKELNDLAENFKIDYKYKDEKKKKNWKKTRFYEK